MKKTPGPAQTVTDQEGETLSRQGRPPGPRRFDIYSRRRLRRHELGHGGRFAESKVAAARVQSRASRFVSRQIADEYRESVLRGLIPVAVTRIVANLATTNPTALAEFYRQVFGLGIPHDMGWITFLANDSQQRIELHTASQGGSGTELPVISIGVDDLDATEAAIRKSGANIVYGPVTEPWGLRRFHFLDPAGNLVNVVDS